MQWEYLVIKRSKQLTWSEFLQENIMDWFWWNYAFDQTVSEQDGLNQLGQDRWELMHVSESVSANSPVKEFYFKRPIP